MTHNLLPFMHTEDDTFNALRRIPYKQMRSIAVRMKIALMMGLTTADLDEEFKRNGWTREEYDAHSIPSDEHAVKAGMIEGIIIKPVNPYKVRHG